MSTSQHQSADSAAATSPELPGAGFPRSARLLTPKQFQTVFSQGRRLNGALFRLHVRPSVAEPTAASGQDATVPITGSSIGDRAGSVPAAEASAANVTARAFASQTHAKADTHSQPQMLGEHSDPVTLAGASAPHGARLGIAVSRRVDPHAVGRNRIKRVARESFRHVRGQLPAGDYVLLAQRAAADADNEQLRQALAALWLRAGAASPSLKRGAAAVTMHADIDAGPPQTPRQPPSS